MKALLYSLFIFLGLGACSKERTCECKNSFSKYDAGSIKATKIKAKKYCKELSGGDTECYLKK